jgi:hypothetical protein
LRDAAQALEKAAARLVCAAETIAAEDDRGAKGRERDGRLAKKSVRRPRKVSSVGPVGKTDREFCVDYNIANRTFYRWKQAGIAPAVTQPAGPGGRVILTREAEDEGRRLRSA